MGFIEECIKLDRHIKKIKGPHASFKWRDLYFKALKYVTPIDLRQMSIGDVFELVGVREAIQPTPHTENKKLTSLQNGIIQVYAELEDQPKDNDVILRLTNRGIVSPKTGEPYAREHFNRTKNDLIRKGKLKM